MQQVAVQGEPKVKKNGRHRLVQELENLESAGILQKLGKALKVVGKFDIQQI